MPPIGRSVFPNWIQTASGPCIRDFFARKRIKKDTGYTLAGWDDSRVADWPLAERILEIIEARLFDNEAYPIVPSIGARRPASGLGEPQAGL